uniref:Photolyase/cryptochrome alpha/beta domain-containing protein n=1 Tax=Electrophorus electricus TaxID=8005 RepID=A0AAY5EI66_ELEEL
MIVNSIHWFRKGLGLQDNPVLLEAVRGEDRRCVFPGPLVGWVI